MADQQEELKLVVTLVDNASAGLGKLQDQIKELSGGPAGTNKHIQKMDEQTKALSETVLKMSGSFGEAFKSLGMLRLGFIGGIAGVAAFGYEMAKQIKDLGDYTDKIRNLGQISRDIGVDPASLKNVGDQLKVYGVTLEQTAEATSKFAQRMAELQRDPGVTQNILEKYTKRTPEAQADMKARIDALNHAATLEDKLNIVLQMRENIKKNARGRGETEERAADEANRITGQLFGYDAVLSRAGQLKNITAAQQKAWDDSQKAAEHLSETIGKMRGELEAVDDVMKRIWVRWATPPAEWLEKATGYLKEGVEKAESYPGGFKGLLDKIEQDRHDRAIANAPHDFEGRWPGANELLNKPLRPQNQSYRSGAIDNPMLQHVAFVSEEQKKGVDANTEQLKRLNDMLATAMGLNGNGGGGFQNAAFTGEGFAGNANLGSRGTTPRFGNKEYPNLGNLGGDTSVDGSAARTPRMTQSKREVAQIAAGALRKGGMSDNMIAGIFANISDESGFNPNLRHPDQPHYGGEAHFAHGLYQEGGAEWNNYSAWLAKEHPGGNWRDPAMQSEFLATRMKSGYAGTWKRMQAARTPGEAAAIFVNEYLKPAAQFRSSRMAKYMRGVPGLGAYTGRNQVAGPPTAPPTVADQPPHDTITMNDFGGGSFGDHGMTPAGLKAFGERRLMHNAGDLTRENLLAHARRQMDAEGNLMKVEGSGKIRVDVNAPKGTHVAAESSGLFKTIETYRQTQMVPAERGPSVWGER